ncbi:MAG: hypothetical protein ABSA94_15640 [Acidobacteriaceae bacterium]
MKSYPFGRCRRVHLNGARCTMPAKHGGEVCYNHERHLRAVRRVRPILPDTTPLSPLVSFVYMEDHASILHNLNAIALSFAHHQIDHRQVGTLTYLMQTCLKTLRQMEQLETRPTLDEIVTDVVFDEHDQPLAAPDPQADALSASPEPLAAESPSPDSLDLQAVAAEPTNRYQPPTPGSRLPAPSHRLQATGCLLSNTSASTQNNPPVFTHMYFKEGVGGQAPSPRLQAPGCRL